MISILLADSGSRRFTFVLLAVFVFGTFPGAIQGQNPPGMNAAKPAKILPLDGEVFVCVGHAAFVIMPPRLDPGKKIPWVWYAPTLPSLPGPEEKWMFQKFLDAGIGIAGIDVGESFGSPAGVLLYSKFYAELTQRRGFSAKPCLLPRSRGGLMLYNWAVEHPDSVAGIAGIYPVGDLRSYPGLQKAAGAYGMTAQQLEAALPEHNPVDRLAALAQAHVPIFHIHGDNDKIVPLPDNSGEVAKRYQALGGDMTLKIAPGQGHSVWPGFFQCQELVDFVITHLGAARCLEAGKSQAFSKTFPSRKTGIGPIRPRTRSGLPKSAGISALAR